LSVEKAGSFAQVRRHDIGEREQLRAHGVDGIWLEQHVAAGCNHDGIDDERHAGEGCEAAHDCFDSGAVGQHAGLDGADAQVVGERGHLRGDDGGGKLKDRLHALRVLRGDRRDDGGAVDAEGRERLEVGLDAGAARAVRAGNGQGNRRRRHRSAPRREVA
jgi:hypothetical protein